MGMRQARWAAAVLALAQAAQAARVAVLPLVPSDASDPREGWSAAVKLMPRLDARWAVRALDWSELSQALERRGLDRKALRDPEALRRLGLALGMDAVVAGTFRTEGARLVALPILVATRDGRVLREAPRTFDRDVTVEPPVLDAEDSLSLRDAPSDYDACEAAGERVDALEAHILELKARYWALQLRRGVSYRTLKFNPGSTISDPELKRRFYSRMRDWLRQPVIPELTPHETLQFAQADSAAFDIARRCGIL